MSFFFSFHSFTKLHGIIFFFSLKIIDKWKIHTMVHFLDQRKRCGIYFYTFLGLGQCFRFSGGPEISLTILRKNLTKKLWFKSLRYLPTSGIGSIRYHQGSQTQTQAEAEAEARLGQSRPRFLSKKRFVNVRTAHIH